MKVKVNNKSRVIITSCQSTKSRNTVGTTHMQRERCFNNRNIQACPRQLFIDYLIELIIQIQSEGNEIMLVAYVSRNSLTRKMSRALRQVGLIEAYQKKFHKIRLASHTRVREKIDVVWLSSVVTPLNVTFLPQNFGAGDHRVTLVDFKRNDDIGHSASICHPNMRRIICEKNRMQYKNIFNMRQS